MHVSVINIRCLIDSLQGWDDHTGSASDEDVNLANEMDGMQVLLHDVASNDMSIVSGRDVPSTGDARTVVRTSVRYGQQIVVTLSQFVSFKLFFYLFKRFEIFIVATDKVRFSLQVLTLRKSLNKANNEHF